MKNTFLIVAILNLLASCGSDGPLQKRSAGSASEDPTPEVVAKDPLPLVSKDLLRHFVDHNRKMIYVVLYPTIEIAKWPIHLDTELWEKLDIKLDFARPQSFIDDMHVLKAAYPNYLFSKAPSVGMQEGKNYRLWLSIPSLKYSDQNSYQIGIEGPYFIKEIYLSARQSMDSAGDFERPNFGQIKGEIRFYNPLSHQEETARYECSFSYNKSECRGAKM